MKLPGFIALGLTLLSAAASVSCGSAATHLMYVTTDQGVYGFRVENKSGKLTNVFGSPFIIGNTPAGIAVGASGQFAYVANQLDNTISVLKIDPLSGVLTEVRPRVNSGGFSPKAMLLDAASNTLFVANQLSNSVSLFTIGSKGTLTAGPTISVGSQPAALAFASGLLFVSVPNFSRIYVFNVSSGALTPVAGSPFLVSGGLAALAVDASAKFLYAPNPAANTVSVFSIQSGVLSPVAGSPFANSSTSGATTSPVSAALDSSATHVYVANFGSANLSQYSIGTNGSLTALSTSTVGVGTNPLTISFDPVGKYVFVTNVGSKSITELTINSDATLGTSSNTVTLPEVPNGIALTK